MSLPRIRTVPTASRATAVQIIWRYRNNRPVLDHIGSAHTDADLELLKAKARRIIDDAYPSLDFNTLPIPEATGSADKPLAVASQRAGVLLDAITADYQHIGLDKATGGDTVFYDLVAARLIHPGSKFDTIETLAEVGHTSASYATIKRHLPTYATQIFRDRLTRTLATHIALGPGVMVLV